MYYLKTLGQLSLHATGPKGPPLLGSSKPLAVLAYLATLPGRRARRDQVAELLWQGADVGRARSSLREALLYIAQRVGRSLIEADETMLKLDERQLDVDLWEFDRALSAGHYRRVVELYAGPFVLGLERESGPVLDAWIEAEDERLRAGLELACSRLVAQEIEKGEAAEAVAHARRFVELNPLNETAQLALVRALEAAGDRVGARQSYRSYRSLLRETLDGEPSEEMERAIAALRDGVPPEPTPAAQEPAVPPRRAALGWRRAVAAGVGGAALLVAATLFVWQPRPSGGLDAALAGLSASFYVHFGRIDPEALARVELRGPDLRWEATPFGPGDVPSPDGRHAAALVPSDSGWGLAVTDLRAGTRRSLRTGGGCEGPIAWSPDSRVILYSEHRPLAGVPNHGYAFMAYDLARDRAWSISDRSAGAPMRGAWSPDGTRIAFIAAGASGPDLFVADADGANSINLTNDAAIDLDPAWSPDGRLLAFASERYPGVRLFTVSPGGSAPRQVTTGFARDALPLWVSTSALVFVREEPGGRRDLWALSLASGAPYRLSERGDVLSIVAPADGSGRWIERLTITPIGIFDAGVSPGQRVRLSAALHDVSGATVQGEAARLRWRVSDTLVAAMAPDGWLTVRAPGRAWAVANFGGWVADSIELVARELVEAPVTLLLYEDWSRGLTSGRWIRFGTPLPATRPTGGPEGAGVFINRGDATYPTGVVSRQAFATRNGLTVEVWARMPFSGGSDQHFGLGLLTEGVPGDRAEWTEAPLIVEFSVRGAGTQGRVQALVRLGRTEHPIPVPESLDEWRRYELQLDADGRVSLVIDGRLYWRSLDGLQPEALQPAHVVLGWRSVGTEVAHGLLRAYYGSRYRLAAPDSLAAREALP